MLNAPQSSKQTYPFCHTVPTNYKINKQKREDTVSETSRSSEYYPSKNILKSQ